MSDYWNLQDVESISFHQGGTSSPIFLQNYLHFIKIVFNFVEEKI